LTLLKTSLAVPFCINRGQQWAALAAVSAAQFSRFPGTSRRGCGYSALTATPARANPARRKIAQNREGKMIDTSLLMPLLHTAQAVIAWIAGANISSIPAV